MVSPSTLIEASTPSTAWLKLRAPPVAGVTLKFPNPPDVLLTMDSREPVSSVTTDAVKPRLSPLIVLATSARVLVPVPVETVVTVPVGPVTVRLPAARSVEALATVLDDQEAVLARLLTTIV